MFSVSKDVILKQRSRVLVLLFKFPDSPIRKDHFLRQVGENGRLLRIDFVLSYENSNDKRKVLRRRAYEQNLIEAGLILEHEVSKKVRYFYRFPFCKQIAIFHFF